MAEGFGQAVLNILLMIVMFTVNLGIVNLLPLPALDGGRLLFLLWEGVTRHPVPAKYEGYVHAVGFVLFIGLTVVIAFHDISALSKDSDHTRGPGSRGLRLRRRGKGGTDMQRRISKQVMAGDVAIGGGAPITVQSMLNVPSTTSRAASGRPCAWSGRAARSCGRPSPIKRPCPHPRHQGEGVHPAGGGHPL